MIANCKPGRYDIVLRQGTDVSRTFAVTDASGEAVDFTGFTARMQARPSASSTTVITSRDMTDGIAIEGGSITVSWSNAETSAMPAGKGVYDLEVEDADGRVTCLIAGDFTVVREITR